MGPPVRAGARPAPERPEPGRRCVVRAPASSANLGPGFDALAVALSVWLTLEVEPAERFEVRSDVPGVALDRTNLCVRAFELLHPADGLRFSIRSDVAPAAGLGSSAAAIVAGLVAADRLGEGGAPLLDLAVGLEGHPDNVSAALLGGFVLSAGGAAERFWPAVDLEAVLARPPGTVPTAGARAALPPEVALADAVHNTAHAALLVLGLVRGDPEVVARGLSDRLHQPRRAHLYPRSMELLGRARAVGALGATISGAGPTVLFWTEAGAGAAVARRLADEAPDCDVREVGFESSGATVLAA